MANRVFLSLSDELKNRLQKLSTEYGVSEGDVLRNLINKEYYGDFRKVKFGYQAGVGASERREGKGAKKLEREEKINELKTMPADEFINFLYESGLAEEYYSNTDMYDWKIETTEEHGFEQFKSVGVGKNDPEMKTGGTIGDREELIKELLKSKLI